VLVSSSAASRWLIKDMRTSLVDSGLFARLRLLLRVQCMMKSTSQKTKYIIGVASCTHSSCDVERFPRQKCLVMFKLNAAVQLALERAKGEKGEKIGF
jgi:hypothetical protein